MKKSFLFRGLLLAALAAAVTPAVAGPFFDGRHRNGFRSSSMDPLVDETGITVLGVDIRAGGSTPAVAARFVAGLPVNLQARVIHNCAVMDTNTLLVAPSVVRFCRALNAARP